MNAPDSVKQKINELLDNHWEELLQNKEYTDVLYVNDWYFPIKVSITQVGKYCVIKILPKSGMYEEQK